MQSFTEVFPAIDRAFEQSVRLLAQRDLLDSQSKRAMGDLNEVRRDLAEKDYLDALFLDVLQRSQARAVGTFEKILTSMLQDVIPNTGSEVALDLTLERGKPCLHFGVRKSNGYVHSVLHGNGGGVRNIISAGAQMYALYKSGGTLRPFMMLDEADHWLEPRRIQSFYGVILDMSVRLGLQTLIISHKPLDMIFPAGVPQNVQILRLVQDGTQPGGVDASHIEASLTVSNGGLAPDRKGIREIRLTHYRSHPNSVYPLAPGMNVLIGPNNGGKSAVIEAVHSVTHGAREDGVIRDAESSCEVAIEDERGTLRWTRRRAGRPREHYAWSPHLDDKSEPREEGSRGGPPDWVMPLIRMGGPTDMPIQVSEQNGHSFILDDPAPRRAEILSVGDSSSLAYAMIAEHQALIASLREQEKSITQQIESLDARAQWMDRIGLTAENLKAHIERWKEASVFLRERVQKQQRQAQLLKAMEQRAHLRETFQRLRDEAPETLLHHLRENLTSLQARRDASERRTQLGRRLRDLRISQAAWNALQPLVLPTLPVLKTERQIAIGRRLGAWQKMRTLQAQVQALSAQDLRVRLMGLARLEQGSQGEDRRARFLEIFQAAGAGVTSAKSDVEKSLSTINEAREHLEKLRVEMGDSCPVCGQRIDATLLEHAHG